MNAKTNFRFGRSTGKPFSFTYPAFIYFVNCVGSALNAGSDSPSSSILKMPTLQKSRSALAFDLIIYHLVFPASSIKYLDYQPDPFIKYNLFVVLIFRTYF